MVRRSAEMVMMVEAATPKLDGPEREHRVPGDQAAAPGRRHGKKTANGANAKTNMVFFDGHVALLDTEPFTRDAKTNPARTMPWSIITRTRSFS
jgi:prepilin-type processing-associated H-X9-DG protein